ncbi:MAG TPA: YciI family protein [Steroidobacteraceae bacterium]|nr:YciI family protein [Steroidobacteraceae bacterium]
MKVLVFVKATPNSEKGIFQPSEVMTKMFNDMGKFNEKLVAAGIMVEADGLRPSSAGKRVTFSDGGVTNVVDGPFAETKELVAGYWIWNVKSMDEALFWARQCPNPMPGEEGTIELRPTNSLEDFEALLTDEIRDRFERTGKEMARQKKAKSKPKAKAKVSGKKKSAPVRKKTKSTRAKAKK